MGSNPANPFNAPTLTPVCSNLALLIPNIASLKELSYRPPPRFNHLEQMVFPRVDVQKSISKSVKKYK